MKKNAIIFMMLGQMFTLACLGQEIKLAKTISVTTLDHMLPISVTKVSGFANKNFNADELPINGVLNRANRLYTIDDILISLSEQQMRPEVDYIENLKRHYDDLNKRSDDYSSKTTTVNNNNFFILLRSRSDMPYYMFFGVGPDQRSRVVGTLHFSSKNAEKAKAVLNELIQGIKFKVQ